MQQLVRENLLEIFNHLIGYYNPSKYQYWRIKFSDYNYEGGVGNGYGYYDCTGDCDHEITPSLWYSYYNLTFGKSYLICDFNWLKENKFCEGEYIQLPYNRER